MGIESIPVAALLSSKPAVPMPSALQGMGQPAAERPTEDKTAKGFRNLLNGLHAGEQSTTEPIAPPADGGLAGVAADGEKPQKTSPLDTPAAPDAASVMSGYWMPVPVPQATPVVSVPGVSDVLGTATGTSDVAVQTAQTAESVGLAGPAAGGGVPDARAQAVHLANYASVFEQIQSRLAASGGSGAGVAAMAAAAAQNAAGSGLNGVAKPVLGTAVADSRAAQLASVPPGAGWALPVTQASALQAATDAAEALALAVNTSGDKPEAVPAGQAADGSAGQNHFTPTVHFESASASVDMQQPAPEAAVADQVSYWISQGIQNAELTFHGDSEPVQVRISLSGNEAHVEFLTDQLETRDLLTGAASHLEEMLHSEGMVLSGLSVGASGTGGANDRERRSPSEARKNTAQPAPEAEAVRPTAPRGAPGRTVDLFV